MAQARRVPEAEREAGVYTNEQLMRIVDATMGPADSVEHPRNAPTPRASAEDALQMWQVLQLLEREQPPAEGTDDRRLYDRAASVLSEGSGQVEDARYALHMAIRDVLRMTSERVQSPNDVGGLAEPLRNMLFTIQDRANSLERDTYLAYRPPAVSNAIANIIDTIGGGRPGEEGLQRTRPGEPEPFQVRTRELRAFEMPIRDIGRIHLIESAGELPYLAAAGEVSAELESIFGGSHEAAQQGADALARAIEMRANGEAQHMGCNELREALEQVSHPQLVNNDMFRSALEDLRNNQRDAAIDKLLSLTDTPLNALIDTANNVEIVRVDQRALVVYHAGVTMRFDFGGNMEAFTRYLRTEDERNFEPRLLYFGLGLYYEMLLISGWRREGMLDVETGEMTEQGERTRIRGTGHAATTTLSLGVGSSIRGEPVEWVVHCNFGYRYRELSREDVGVETSYGTERTLPEGQRRVHEPYIGFWGLEVRMPGRGSRRPVARIMPARMGLGFVGRPDNVLGYATWRQNPVQEGGFTLQLEETAQISYLLRQLYLTGEINARLIHQWENGMALMGGPGIRVDVRGMDIEGQPTVASIESYGELAYRPLPWLTVSARGGYFVERGGPEWNRIPDNYFLGGNVAMDFGQVGGRIPLSTTPVRMEVTEPVRSDFLWAARWADEAAPEQLSGDEASRMATDLANLIERQAGTDTWSFGGSDRYNTALEHLRAGRLREGIDALRRIDAFRELEQRLEVREEER
ncbi:hypothetical protein GF318_03750 [Candidatus Micrarchaeota archaeon]|nr:hypothetical protein [Candidatus Micrarchaeota archaeon]